MPGDPTSLSAGFVTTVLTDGEGRLWAGTLGDGINVMEGRDADGKPRFRRLGTAEGLPNNAVAKLLADRMGRIWASTANGLAVIDPKTFAVRSLRRAEGIAISGYWTNSGTAAAAASRYCCSTWTGSSRSMTHWSMMPAMRC